MKEKYNANDLYVGELEYISSEVTPYGPMVKKIKEKFIFEKVEIVENKPKKGILSLFKNGTENDVEEETREEIQEVFTGVALDLDDASYFDVPYIINMKPYVELFPEEKDSEICMMNMLLIHDDINQKSKTKTKKSNKK